MSALRRALRLGAGVARVGAAMATGRPHPFSMTFILTHRCNFSCAYCNIPAAADQEMTTAELCGAIDELADAGLARASFSGGEVFVRKDALDIVRHARRRGLMTSLNTNGWLVEPLLDELAEALDLLVVSLDGPQAQHDHGRRREGSYERVLTVLDGAARRGLPTATITVVSSQRLEVVDEVLELARRHDFYAYFQPAYVDCFSHGRGLDPSMGPRVLADLAARLEAARRAGQPVGASAGFLARLARGPDFGDCGRCAAGRFFGTVMPDGTVVPCHLTSGDHAYPNGRKVGFAEAFRSLPRPKPGPGCAISPYQETDLIFSGDGRAMLSAVARLRGRARPPLSPDSGRGQG